MSKNRTKNRNKIKSRLIEKERKRRKRKAKKSEKEARSNHKKLRQSNLVAQLEQQSHPTFDRGAFMGADRGSPKINSSGSTKNTKVFKKDSWIPPEIIKEQLDMDSKVEEIDAQADSEFNKAAWGPK
tara:strand:+ start:2373 stop:2753 length:381 start_codon:yes stop_codon:yes gene_type:complete